MTSFDTKRLHFLRRIGDAFNVILVLQIIDFLKLHFLIYFGDALRFLRGGNFFFNY